MDFKLSFKTKAPIASIATSRDKVLYVATNSHLTCYETCPVKKVFAKKLDEYVDIIAVAFSKADDTEFLVQLDTKSKALRFLSSEGKPVLVTMLQKQPNKLLASSENFIAYAYNDENKVYMELLSIDKGTPQVSSHGRAIEVPFESGRVRSICMSKSNKGNPVVVCSNVFNPSKTKKSEKALITMVLSKQIGYSKFTFDDLDQNASIFDLIDLVCDKDNIFVLNSTGNAVYQVTKIGKHVRKVCLVGANFPFSSVSHIRLDEDNKYVYMVPEKDMVYKFTYE